jgi:hypothetical protein
MKYCGHFPIFSPYLEIRFIREVDSCKVLRLSKAMPGDSDCTKCNSMALICAKPATLYLCISVDNSPAERASGDGANGATSHDRLSQLN